MSLVILLSFAIARNFYYLRKFTPYPEKPEKFEVVDETVFSPLKMTQLTNKIKKKCYKLKDYQVVL